MTKTATDGTKLYLCADGVYRSLGPTMWAYRRRQQRGPA